MTDVFIVTSASDTVGEPDVVVIPAFGRIRWHVEYPLAASASQAYFWTEQWQESEREADEDIRSGRSREFAGVEELIEWLHSDEE
ncbi:MAG: hypothetical protein HY023_06440 [Chloroflexi bacterium]|nr:hypothetical protein [Chloroflexota bacterium]